MTPSHHSSRFTRQPSVALLRLVASGHTTPSLLRSAGATSQISHFQLPSSAHQPVSLGVKGQTMLTFYNDTDGFFFSLRDHFSLLEHVFCLNVSSVGAIIYCLGLYQWRPVACPMPGTGAPEGGTIPVLTELMGELEQPTITQVRDPNSAGGKRKHPR